MFKNFLGLGSLQDLSILATIVATIVQLLKQIVPKKFPTKLLTLIVSIVATLIFLLNTNPFSIGLIISGILMGCVVAFIAMNGFDTFKDIYKRFSDNEEEKGES